MIRVLHVAGGLEPELGGPTVAILNYVRASIASDVEAHLVVTVDDPASPTSRAVSESLAAHGAHVWLVRRTGGFTGRASRWGISAPLLWWLLRRASEFDIIVVHGAWLFSSLAAVVAGRIAGKAPAMIPHESLTAFDVEKKGSRARVLAKSFLARVYARSCRLFLFTSELECRDSLDDRTRGRKTVVRIPVFDVVSAVARHRAARDSQPFCVGFLGRFHPKKNLNVLIEAMPLLPEGVTLVVGGDGPAEYRRELEDEAATLGVRDRIVWRGFVSANDKDAFFESIDVLVMPSAYESFGIVAAESMGRGVPALVSPRTGIAELIAQHGGGLIVEPTARDLAETISRLASDRSLLQQLAGAAPDAVKELTVERIGIRLRDEYHRLVGADQSR